MKNPKNQRGVAAVELAILIVPLLVLTFGVTEFGRAIYQYNILAKATRDATRFLSAQGPGDPGDVAAAQCLAVYGNRDCTGTVLVPSLTTAMVNVCDSLGCPGTHQNQATGSGVINLVTVTITGYPFTSLVPFVVPNITFGPISTTMRQVL
ncbi:MAG: TadE-like protein [Herminiimonas sp.]|nr:TadE-like protein [Herminiimonas sp.]